MSILKSMSIGLIDNYMNFVMLIWKLWNQIPSKLS